MTILGIAHYNFRLERTLMEEVRDFYVQVVGMSVGPRPAVDIPGDFGSTPPVGMSCTWQRKIRMDKSPSRFGARPSIT